LLRRVKLLRLKETEGKGVGQIEVPLARRCKNVMSLFDDSYFLLEPHLRKDRGIQTAMFVPGL